MALSINTNIASLQAQNNLSQVNKALSQNQERLSSGLRINSAADDAAGMAISSRMTSQIQGLNQAVSNANDAMSVSNTAEGALQETTDILQRMRELSVQSANDSNTDSDRASIQDEVNQLKSEIDRIAQNTNFNGQKLLNGEFTNKSFQVGAQSEQTIGLSVDSAQGKDLGNYTLNSNNDTTVGMDAAVRALEASATGAGMDAVNTGAETGGAVDNAIPTQTISVTTGDGTTNTLGISAQSDKAADKLANELSSVGGVVQANAQSHSAGLNIDTTSFNTDTANSSSNTVSFELHGSSQTQAFSFEVNESDSGGVYQEIADKINASAPGDLQASTAAGTTGVKITSTSGENIGLDEVTYTAAGASGDTTGETYTLGGTPVSTSSRAAVKVSALNVELESGAQISSDAGQSNNIFGATSNTAVATNALNQGVSDDSNGNNVAEQKLTVTGEQGSKEVDVKQNNSAYTIANSINNASGSTGVSAKAETTLTMNGLNEDGTVSFDLKGSNGDPRQVSATVTKGNLNPLVNAINNESGATGITAEIGSEGSSVKLTQDEGHDIDIENFDHSASDSTTTGEIDVLGPADSAVRRTSRSPCLTMTPKMTTTRTTAPQWAGH